jgi:hypothetical protein
MVDLFALVVAQGQLINMIINSGFKRRFIIYNSNATTEFLQVWQQTYYRNIFYSNSDYPTQKLGF